MSADEQSHHEEAKSENDASPPSQHSEEPKKRYVNKKRMHLLFQQAEVGPIIGKGGANIKEIKEKSKCQLSFVPEAQRNRSLIISGDKENFPIVIEGVANCLQNKEKNGGVVSIFWFLIREQAIGLIGKGGTTCQNIKKSTNVSLSVMFDTDYAAREILVRITGTPEQLRAAFELILTKYVTETDRAFKPRNFGNPGNFNDRRPTQSKYRGPSQFRIDSVQSIKVSREVAGAIIGRNGGNINQIRMFSKANIRVTSPSNGETMATIVVSGRPGAVARAFEKIEECIEIFLAQRVRKQAAQEGIAPNNKPRNKRTQEVIHVRTKNVNSSK